MISWVLFGLAMLFFLIIGIHGIIEMYKDNKILNELDAKGRKHDE